MDKCQQFTIDRFDIEAEQEGRALKRQGFHFTKFNGRTTIKSGGPKNRKYKHQN